MKWKRKANVENNKIKFLYETHSTTVTATCSPPSPVSFKWRLKMLLPANIISTFTNCLYYFISTEIMSFTGFCYLPSSLLDIPNALLYYWNCCVRFFSFFKHLLLQLNSYCRPRNFAMDCQKPYRIFLVHCFA